MRKYILLGVITVALLNISWAYVVTVKQKLVGILQITSAIENVRYLEITRDEVYFEVAEEADWVQLNYNCSVIPKINFFSIASFNFCSTSSNFKILFQKYLA